MKVVRALFTLLIVLALGATHTFAGASFAEREAAPQLAPEEEREAREFAEAFLKRLEEEQDIAPLVGEMFVGDYAERLHASISSAGSLNFLDRLAAAEATRDEVLRYNVAFSNLVLMASLYVNDARLAAKAVDEKGDGVGETKEADLKPADIFPPDVLELLRADPLLSRFVAEDEEGDDEEGFIETAEQLRAVTPTIERANELLRQHLTSEQKQRAFADWRRKAEDEDGFSMRPYATVTYKEWYGHPAGTRLVCLSLLVFHVELIRVGSRYKILAMYVLDDD